MKKCTKCLLILPISEFHKAKQGKFGVCSVCKKCTTKYYIEHNSFRRRNRFPYKECAKCKIVKPRSAFHFSNKDKNWIKSDCKECRSKENYNPKSNRHTSPEVRRQKQLEYKKKFYLMDFARNKEKYRLYTIKRRALLKKAKGSFSEEEWLEKLKDYGYKCYYCKRKLTSDTATKDHKIPLSKGGDNYITNIVPACHKCNSGKCDSIFYIPKYISYET